MIQTQQQNPQQENQCKHYKRNCKIQAPCCQQWFMCRFCHDENVEQTQIDHYNQSLQQQQQNFVSEESISLKINDINTCLVQKMDRTLIQYIYCINCNHIQKPQQTCSNCHTTLGKYFCNICNLFDNDPQKDIYHCPKCSICIIGKQSEMYHCDSCGICIKKEFQNNHICIKDALDRECPICLESLKHSSKKCVHFKNCGHWIHQACFKQYIQDKVNKCPICTQAIRKQTPQSITDMDQILKQALENLQGNQSSGITYVQILCNECSHISPRVPETYTGLYKCQFSNCGTYNTKLIQQ